MAKLASCVLVIVLFSQSILVFSRQIDYDRIVFPGQEDNTIPGTQTSKVTPTPPSSTTIQTEPEVTETSRGVTFTPPSSTIIATVTPEIPETPESVTLTPSSSTIATVTEASSFDRDAQQCIANCLVTPQYNPVCGTNRQTYDNVNKLKCAQFCGIQVNVSHIGICRSSG